jgi:peptide deformylase
MSDRPAPDSPAPAPLSFDLTLFPAPVLRKKADPVTRFDGELAAFVEAMFNTMIASGGVGLAAPQVGHKTRVLVVSERGDRENGFALINPVILERSGPTTLYEEGCLSFPGIYAEVARPDRCKVEAQDLAGNKSVHEYSGFVARIVQHEYDHLEGVLLVDRMSPADKLQNKVALQELVERFQAAQSGAGKARSLPRRR